MMLATYLDGPTLAIVLGGTLAATMLRCGLADVRVATTALGEALFARRGFAGEEVRARLAGQMQEIRHDGLLRSNPRPTGDVEFDQGLDALIGHRSLAAFQSVMVGYRMHRAALAETATRTWLQAAELAPVFGLAGTLISLSKLPVNGIDRGAYMAAIAMAVHATLYGLVAANLLLAPLGRLVERVARRQDDARQHLVDWVVAELEHVTVLRNDVRKGAAKEAREEHRFDHNRPELPQPDRAHREGFDGPRLILPGEEGAPPMTEGPMTKGPTAEGRVA